MHRIHTGLRKLLVKLCIKSHTLVCAGTDAQDDSSSDDEEFDPHVPQGIALQPAEPPDPYFASQPLGMQA